MRTINIGLFGLGVVGSGVVDILHRNQELIAQRLGAPLRVSRAVTANPSKPRDVPLDGIQVTADPADILEDPTIDIVVEAIGGTTVARDVVLQALQRGKPVVTANKALLAEHAEEVFPLAYQQGVPLGMEASVAGGIPVLRSLKEGLASERILEISGIVNGTSNYILSKMTGEGSEFEAVLAEAQALGYAEADPTFDVDGIDAAHKLAVLVSLAYGTIVPFGDIHTEGIRHVTPLDIDFARQLGFAVKLLAIGKRHENGVEARVHPALVAHDHLLAAVDGVFNAVFLTGDNVDATMSYGRGAGGGPTGSAVVSDVIDIARNLLAGITLKIPQLSVQGEHLQRLPVLPISEITSEYYLRFQVLDRPRVLASITRIFGDHNISIQSAIQPGQPDGDADAPVQVILTTHRAQEKNVQQALKEIAPMDFIVAPTQLIRIERFAG